ncbi:citryl-CoA lyase [Pelomonas sp. KK5]|uniref:citryl-CoA lyase n=1 Tax=Pelomonas sp. KK5 TaxID=1855730 RepID=UPI00097C992C|nr:citryl-CoA lyase [Pelomonas sp. KK5]
MSAGSKHAGKTAEQVIDDAKAWWSTAIIDIKPNQIDIRGYPIQELIGHLSYADMAWLMLRGELPPPAQSRLLEATLVAGIDHGPHAPSIAISRMAVTCGLPLNGAMASAINALDDIHGGAGQQCMELMRAIGAMAPEGEDASDEQVAAVIADWQARRGKVIPGFGHRWHSVDPRAVRLLAMVSEAEAVGVISGRFGRIASAIERVLSANKGQPIPLNIDGVTAAIYLALGFEPELGRGLFILSRSIGILSHAWEQRQQGGRIKGPMAPSIPYTYTGPARRHLDR